ncbi:MAG: hypothetical protein WDN08_18570 [Rhizomicrobium sp.]
MPWPKPMVAVSTVPQLLRGNSGARALGEFRPQGVQQAEAGEERALARGAGAQRDLGGADVGGMGEDLARGVGRRHVLGFVDRVLADPEALADGEDFVQPDGAVVERQREGQDLEHRAELVAVAGHDVLVAVVAGEMAVVGIEVGHRHHGEDLAGVDVHHDAAGLDRAEGVARRLNLGGEDVLHAHVDGGGDRLVGGGAQLDVEAAFETGLALAVRVGTPRTWAAARPCG